MPMKWSPENDQLLLIKIIEVCAVNPDARQIAELWPNKEGEDRPTPRAITERLVKIRQQIRANGGDLKITGKNAKGSSNSASNNKPKTNRVTKPHPQAKKTAKPPSTPSNNSSEGTVKHEKNEEDDEARIQESLLMTPPASIKRKHSVLGDDDDDGPFKRERTDDVDYQGELFTGPSIFDGSYDEA